MVSLKGFVFLAWISFGLGSVLYAVLATAYDRMIIFKEPIPDKELPGHVIASGQVPNEGSCRVKCYLEPNCVSINVGPDTKGQLTCELNNHTDESSSRKHTLLKERRGFTHYSVENSCLDNPCRGINALCQVGFSSSGYRCACVAGHTPDCREPLGMGNGDIRNWQIKASHPRGTTNGTGRLNNTVWYSDSNDTDQWLQIDLISQHTVITRVATQGGKRNHSGKNDSSWVTKYKLQYTDDRTSFQFYKTTTGEKEFDGNRDQDTVVEHDLNPPIRARYIRFRPMEWNSSIAMRVELYGCQNCVFGAGSTPGSNYVLFTKSENWNNARANCQRLGADLVNIESVKENDFIEMKVLNFSGSDTGKYWIGLSDQVHEGEWIWTDGSLISNTYSNWADNQPDNKNDKHDCAVIEKIIRNGSHIETKWNDRNCKTEQDYICEMSQF